VTAAATRGGADGFGARLAEVAASVGPLCIGIDPHPYLLERWDLDDTATGAETFGRWVVEAAVGRAGIVKPQVAFFERYGSAGYAALERVLAAARAQGLLVIADAKRGDIGTSVEAYGEAWLTPGAPLEVDALTLSPYLGIGALTDVLVRALELGKGAFVLAATSNPQAEEVQAALVGAGGQKRGPSAVTVASSIVGEVHRLQDGTPGPSSVGVVVGATVALDRVGLSGDALAGIPVLAPGFGAQGARIADLPAVFGAAAADVVPTVSRSVLDAGPAGLADAISAAAAEVAECRA